MGTFLSASASCASPATCGVCNTNRPVGEMGCGLCEARRIPEVCDQCKRQVAFCARMTSILAEEGLARN